MAERRRALGRREFVAGGALLASAALAGRRRQALAQPATPGPISLDPAPPSALGAPPVPAAAVSTAADAVPEAVAFAPYAEFGTDAAPGEFPRVVRHAFGETTIETRPERLVVLDSGELDAAVYLGLIPVGAAEYLPTGLPQYVADRVAGVALVGTTAEPDLEAILALAPDLILSSKLRNDEATYNLLASIAPTVFAERPGVTFKQNFKLYAQALGREVEARAIIDRYEDGVRALNAALPLPRPTTSIVQIRSDEVRFYQRANFLGQILTDLGFPRSEAENVDDFAAYGSAENLLEYADGEFIILAIQGGDTNELAPEILEGDIWRLLPAVQAGNVLNAPSDTFIGGIGYGAAMDVVNIIAGHFGIDPVIETAS